MVAVSLGSVVAVEPGSEDEGRAAPPEGTEGLPPGVRSVPLDPPTVVADPEEVMAPDVGVPLAGGSGTVEVVGG